MSKTEETKNILTKQEFEDYLDSFGKDTGEFTEDELYLIGSKYKELPTSLKRWEELVKILGVDKSGENFRQWIKSKQISDGSIKKNITLISGKTIEDIDFEEFEDKVKEIKEDLYKQEIKTRDNWNAYRRIIREEARLENFKDLLKESIKDLAQLDEVSYKLEGRVDGGEGEEEIEAVLLLSDLHIGVQIDNFYNKYNVEIAKKRLNKVVEDTIKYCNMHGVTRLNVVNLGDLVHGLIHTNARLEQEIDVINQVIVASELMANALNKLQEAAPEVIYRSCTDNHSRAVADKNESVEAENFSKLIDFYLESRLVNSSIKFAHDNIDQEIGLFELLNGDKLAFAHGHHDSYNQAFQVYCGATKQFIKYICLGHFHSSKTKSFMGAKVIVNGSICGTEGYAFSKRLFGEPEQTLLLFEGENLMTVNINLK